MREREPCVYILASGYLGTLYVGATSNLMGRIIQHREGAFDGFTKRHGCKLLVWYEAHETIESARHRELQMKKWNRQWKLTTIEQMNREWTDLFETLA